MPSSAACNIAVAECLPSIMPWCSLLEAMRLVLARSIRAGLPPRRRQAPHGGKESQTGKKATLAPTPGCGVTASSLASPRSILGMEATGRNTVLGDGEQRRNDFFGLGRCKIGLLLVFELLLVFWCIFHLVSRVVSSSVVIPTLSFVCWKKNSEQQSFSKKDRCPVSGIQGGYLSVAPSCGDSPL